MFFSAYGMIVKAIYTFFQTLIYVVPALLIAISMHEFAHGYMSYLLEELGYRGGEDSGVLPKFVNRFFLTIIGL